jgi:WD40 repeat protein
MAFSPDGSWLATAARDRGSVRLWDVHSSIPGEGVPLGRESKVLSVAFSPDGKLLASGWEDGTCWLWPVPSRQVDLAKMERATLLATAADAGPDGTQAAVSWRRWQAVQSAGSSAR